MVYTGLALHTVQNRCFGGWYIYFYREQSFLPIAPDIQRIRRSLHLAEDAICIYSTVNFIFIFEMNSSDLLYSQSDMWISIGLSMFSVFAIGVILGAMITHLLHYKQYKR